MSRTALNVFSSRLATNLKHVAASHVAGAAVSVVKALIVPAILSLQDFAYWQIYLFYSAYAGLFTIGYSDGIYLRHGGVNYEHLPAHRLRSSLRVFASLQVVFMGLAIAACFLESNAEKRLVLILACTNISLMGISSAVTLVLQTSNRLRAYSLINTLDKVSFLVVLPALALLTNLTHTTLIELDLAAKVLAAGAGLIACKALVLGPVSLKKGIVDFYKNSRTGAQLMIANVAGMLVMGVARLFLEYGGTLNDYAAYAFAFSVLSLTLIVAAIISVVLYPTLKAAPPEVYGVYYTRISEYLNVVGLLSVFVYFAAIAFVHLYAPKYATSLPYLNLIFVTVLLQSKMQVVNNTFYKVLRMERKLLEENVSCLAIVLALTGLAHSASAGSPKLLAAATMLTMLYRVYSSQYRLGAICGLPLRGQTQKEIAFFSIFLITTTLLDALTSFAFFACLLGCYLYRRRALLRTWLRSVRTAA